MGITQHLLLEAISELADGLYGLLCSRGTRVSCTDKYR
jgi:hypothetical protein